MTKFSVWVSEAETIDDAVVGRGLLWPASVIQDTEKLLRSYGDRDPHEGIVYLGGREHGTDAIVLCALSPSAETTRGSFQTNSDANAAVVRELASQSLTLVGQTHSHPGHWVGHSGGDDSGALVRFTGFWSIVVPIFAREGMLPLTKCGIHVFQAGSFHRLSMRAIHSRVRVIPSSVDLRELGR